MTKDIASIAAAVLLVRGTINVLTGDTEQATMCAAFAAAFYASVNA